MWKRILILLLLIPLADALLLVVVADYLGWQVTVLLVVLTALLGMIFVQLEGRRTIRRLHRALVDGRPPTNELLDGGFLIAAGAFLLTPGLVTDGVGFLFVFPPTRYVIRSGIKRWILIPYIDNQTGGFATGKVYTYGFPSQESTESGGEHIDLDDESFDVSDDDPQTSR